MFRIFSFLIVTLLFAPALRAEHFWGSKTSQPVDTAPSKLKPGQFIWKGKTVPNGSMETVVDISEQRIYLYRNSILIGVSTISTGRGRRSTPTGAFTVLGKNRHHRSRKYHNAPMPYTHWLTSNGIAMHAGNLPGYAASHGCIRLPTQFAQLLFESSSVGMPVFITKNTAPKANHSTALLAVESKTEKPQILEQQIMKAATFLKPDKTIPVQALAEIESLDVEIQKTQAQVAKIKQELAVIEIRRK